VKRLSSSAGRLSNVSIFPRGQANEDPSSVLIDEIPPRRVATTSVISLAFTRDPRTSKNIKVPSVSPGKDPGTDHHKKQSQKPAQEIASKYWTSTEQLNPDN
jgi:hypothetical protein